MPTQTLIILLTGLLLLATPLARANELFQSSPIDEVSVRTLPDFTVIETDMTGPLDTAWDKGFRIGARYAVLARSSLNTPTIMTFPDWEKNPTVEGLGLHVLVQMLLDPLPDLPQVREHEASLKQMPAMTVACYAFYGDYTSANFQAGLKKIQDYLKSRGIPAAGPPRYLYYSDTAWVPAMWRVGEVQVPIAAGLGQN